MKSRDENLEKAYRQAKDYCHGLADHDYPKFILICDFNTFHLYDENAALDKAVDLCYRSQPFSNETKRIEFLFELYDKYTSGMFSREGKGKKIKIK